ncbi:hypothetical protein DACRYDRAFT_21824 [Dacryopinax primogenitus]|uniref:BTB domain-containing protein n=1 Tax=Dacryopinax primogenitus (strain DJM 731) TaxID=1858805 RepID=M5GA95_DACPD|nr:uncharacterized protein DACRYDRAFT_21824 [Dacryopinax primogenitus]EJU02872.1 hypothetical protein DACRYDRAFT_21824 [Dacryopinax primogenitus]
MELGRAADKWQIEVALWILRREVMSPRFDHLPLRVYTFCCEMDFEDEIELSASKASLSDPRDPCRRDQIGNSSALDLIRIVMMHDAVKKPANLPEALKRNDATRPVPAWHQPILYAWDPLFKRNDADLVVKSSDGVEFRVFSLFLREASPRLADLITTSGASTLPTNASCAKTMEWPEHAGTIQALLRYIYPLGEHPRTEQSTDELMAVLWAAHVWKIEAALRPLRAAIISPERVSSDAMPSAAAWSSIRKEKSLQCMRSRLTQYTTTRLPISLVYLPWIGFTLLTKERGALLQLRLR